MRRWTLALALAAAAAMAPRTGAAHIRWFSPQNKYPDASFALDATTLAVTLGAAAFAALAVLVHRRAEGWPWASRIASAVPVSQEALWRVIAVLAGVMLIATASQDVFLATNIPLPEGSVRLVGQLAQAVVGVLLISQVSFVASAALIVVAGLAALVLAPLAAMADYLVEFVALAAALALVGPRLSPVDAGFARRFGWDPDKGFDLALPILRIGLGATLCILAIHNKLLTPGLGLTFLDDHAFNFMPQLGFSGFTNLHFVYAAGIAELLFGLLLVAGIATRFTTAVLATFFVLTLVAIGPVELVGHAPIFGIALLLIVHGSGGLGLGARKAAMESVPAQA
ncbi:MAG: DoxX family protein [Anaerolineae bacterium]